MRTYVTTFILKSAKIVFSHFLARRPLPEFSNLGRGIYLRVSLKTVNAVRYNTTYFVILIFIFSKMHGKKLLIEGLTINLTIYDPWFEGRSNKSKNFQG